MKAIVIHNCATAAYAKGLGAFFPDWEVRGTNKNLAQQWLAETPPKQKFVDYIRQCDVYIGLSTYQKYESLLPSHAKHIRIPAFSFTGLQPDSFHLEGFDSVLGKGGTLYSKILTGAFLSGFTPKQAEGLFQERIYDDLGYLNEFDKAVDVLVQKYKTADIDLSHSIGRWISRGNFLYTYNHPRVDVLVEILRRALVVNDFLPVSERDRENDPIVFDDLKESIMWPIYPEIAVRQGLKGSLQWRMGRSENYKTLDLSEFVAASFEALAAKPLPQLPDISYWKNIIKTRRNNGDKYESPGATDERLHVSPIG